MNPEKPRLLIIGEAHPENITAFMEQCNVLKIRRKQILYDGRVTRIPKVIPGGNGGKWLRLINEVIIKKAVDNLKQEKISRLFVEEPATKERLAIYSRFCSHKELSRLRLELRREEKRILEQVPLKEFLLSENVTRPLIDKIQNHLTEVKAADNRLLFQFSNAAIAFKSGICDIIPVEDEKLRANASILEFLLNAHGYFSTYKTDLTKEEHEELWYVLKTVKAKFKRLDELREQKMCENIKNNYVEKSALLCGESHAEKIDEALSKKGFKIERRMVGEEFKKIAECIRAESKKE